MVFTTLLKLSSKRVPLIKFRSGGIQAAAAATAPATTSSTAKVASSVQAKPVKSPKKASGPAIEDWELHPRYWRKEIDAKEMDYINNGGPL